MAGRRRASTKPSEHLVVIGSSAGGIDALTTLVSTLPRELPAPILVAQHLDPRRESHLGDILARHSTLPVRTVTDHEPLIPGTIFLVPADRHVIITDHEVSLQADGGRSGPRPSIDRALSSAADAYGEGLIGVILTGAGSDGAAGARHVKASGGTVVIQNPETASYPAMPQSLASTTVDVVADLETMGPLLMDLMTGAYIPTKPSDEAALNAFLDNVREATGIDFSHYKRPTILRRLQRRLVATGSETLATYSRYLQTNPEELQRLSNAFLIKVTEFFRDPDVYDYIGEQVIPKLAEQARENGGELRLWSAGCATGEEAYSLAITAASVLGEQPDGIRVRIFATDVDNEAIEFARRGIYPASAVEQVPAALRKRFFSQSSGQFEVSPAIRAMVAFGQHDLAQRAPFPRIDLVICRNVLIYFTNDLQRRALQLFAFSLRDSGYLVLGKAETTSPLGDHFVLEQPRLKVYRRQGNRVLLTPVRGIQAFGGVPQRQPRQPRTGALTTPFVNDLERARHQAARADNLIRKLPVGMVVIDRKYDIALINDAARNLLGVYGAAIGQDLIHLSQGVPSNELRRAIDAAFRGEPARLIWDIAVSESTSGEMTALEVTAYRQPDGASGTDDVVAIMVRDVTRDHSEIADLHGNLESEAATSQRLREQVERMSDAAEILRQANVELTQVNADLRSQNDELVVSNEEVQAATEEVETLNEEMQATNEELETLNEELQATVEELNTTNDDLEARSNELQSLALTLEKQREVSEAERGRLAAVLAGMADAVIVVDENGKPLLTNGAYESTFGSTDGELYDDTGQALAPTQLPERRAARGEDFAVRFTRDAPDDETRSFEARGRPIEGDEVKGGVVVIRDITDRNIQELQQRFVAMLSHELWTPLTGVSAYLELLERDLRRQGDTKALRYAERALAQARRFSSLIGELLDANRLQAGRVTFAFEPLDVRSVVNEAVAVMQPLAGDRPIEKKQPRSPVMVRGDRDRLEQVVINLLSNAIRHAPDSPSIQVDLTSRGRNAKLTVRDDGPGLDAAARERVTSLFSEVAAAAPSSAGLGLGLYIAGSVVQAHGGTIAVESKPKAGATFTVSLPLMPASRKASAVRPKSVSPSKRRSR